MDWNPVHNQIRRIFATEPDVADMALVTVDTIRRQVAPAVKDVDFGSYPSLLDDAGVLSDPAAFVRGVRRHWTRYLTTLSEIIDDDHLYILEVMREAQICESSPRDQARIASVVYLLLKAHGALEEPVVDLWRLRFESGASLRRGHLFVAPGPVGGAQ